MLGDLLVVGDHDDGPALPVQALEDSEDLQSAAAVQVPGGLVRQKDDGIINQCPGNCHTLLLTSRELARHVVFAIAEPDSIYDFERPLLGIAQLSVLVGQWQHDISQHGGPVEEMKLLEDEADAAIAKLR